MRYPTENYQDVNHYVVDDLDITVAGVGHNSGDVPSEEDVRIATLAAEGWVGEAGASIYTPDTMALCNVAPGAHAITTGNTLHVGFARIRHLDPKAGAVVYAVYEYIAFMCRGKHRVCSASNETIAADLNCSVRSVQYARTRLLELGLLADMDGSDQLSAARVVTIRHFKGSEGAFPLPLQAEIARYVKSIRVKEDSGVRVSHSSPEVDFRPNAPLHARSGGIQTSNSHAKGASEGCKRLHGGVQAIAGGDASGCMGGDASERQRGVQAAAPKGVLGEGELDWENITSVESGDRGVGKGDPAVAGRSLVQVDDLFKEPCHQPLAPAVEHVQQSCPQLAGEVIPLVAAVQLPAKVNKRSAVDRGPMPTPIDPTWQVSDAGKEYARGLGMSDDQIDDAAFSFVSWHAENNHLAKGRFKDWGRRWQDWCRKQAGQLRERGTLGVTGKRALPGRGAPNAADEVIVTFGFGSKVYRKDIEKWVAEARAKHPSEDITDDRINKACDDLREQYEGKKDRQKADTVLREEITLAIVKDCFIDDVSGEYARRREAHKRFREAQMRAFEENEAMERERYRNRR